MKRYLKSIHMRYMLTFMAIMILTILILGVIITNIVNNFTLDLRLRDINNINLQMRSYFKADEKDGKLPKFTDENGQIDPMLIDVLENMSKQMGVMLFDPEGNLIFSAHNNGDSIVTNNKYDKATAGVNAILSLSTSFNISGIRKVRRIYRLTCVLLSSDSFAIISADSHFRPAWSEVKSERKPCLFIASSFIL